MDTKLIQGETSIVTSVWQVLTITFDESNLNLISSTNSQDLAHLKFWTNTKNFVKPMKLFHSWNFFVQRLDTCSYILSTTFWLKFLSLSLIVNLGKQSKIYGVRTSISSTVDDHLRFWINSYEKRTYPRNSEKWKLHLR